MSTKASSWNLPIGQVELAAENVHVWRVHLDVSFPLVAQYQELLSPEEQASAQRFYFERDRSRWIVARGLLRILLGRYTHTNPRHLCFQTNAYGKPTLVFPTRYPPLEFNLSHSADLALYALSWQRPLGVDGEYMRADIPYDEWAQLLPL
ncbi:MAG TPA: hypothetical protein VKR06_32970 [Ktedonosporobacter sp.]|nr:hypothetical protein [Ktedonosporobacter sp.]